MKNTELEIYLRHLPVSLQKFRHPERNRPGWFSHGKCLRNLTETIIRSTKKNELHLNIVYDGSVDELQFDKETLDSINPIINQTTFYPIKSGSALASFNLCLNIARSKATENDKIFYFLENDYIHRDDWAATALDIYYNYNICDYMSLYDHNDKYTYLCYKELTSKIYFSGGHHWRSTPSTCGSFLVRSSVLIEDHEVLISGAKDHAMFQTLIKERARKLITPIPGLATHCMEGLLSPGVDWAALADPVTIP